MASTLNLADLDPNLGPEIICANCCANRFARAGGGHVCLAFSRQTCPLSPFPSLAGHRPVLTHSDVPANRMSVAESVGVT